MPVFNQEEAEAVAWLAQRADDNTPVYADEYGRLLLYEWLLPQVGIIPASGEVPEEAYIFLRSWNIERQQMRMMVRDGVQYKFAGVNLGDIPLLFDNREVIYDNGGARILR